MKLGIIGYGNIAKAMVAGLDGKFNPIYVNDRKPQSKKAYSKKSLQYFKIDDIEKVINLGFEKISINNLAIENLSCVEESISKSKIKSLISIANKSKIPILFSRSTYPYKTIGLLINDNFDENSSNSIAFDLSSTMSAKLAGVIINQPTFLQSDGEQKVSDTVQKLQDLALSHEVQLDFENFEGNEAKIFTDQTSNYDLSIIGSNSSQSWQDRKVIEFVSTNSNSSLLYIPR